ncbi:hypothetical protein [Flavisolibacter tropicus]|uniref:Uncharacterized protein n=1 Tax=Flavisolibacter tropicus TaxID=1492898 RepID=A0A172TVF6_9BACT|nr:hypothetical protein [Flavisolibacter tropicus]ANE50966.1 hypothetical protein SY85_11085 [Flavisolibacter tropicus]
MLRTALVIIILAVLPSCFLFKDYKRREFTYTRTGDSTSTTVATIVPKGYKRVKEIADSSGHQGLAYYYKDGAELYILYTPLVDNYQPIDTLRHIPKPQLQGGVFYKGIDSTRRWWREAQPPSFRFGYRNVSSEKEVFFDSAVNYIKPGMPQKRKKGLFGTKKA